jgi:hypothetical protein
MIRPVPALLAAALAIALASGVSAQPPAGAPAPVPMKGAKTFLNTKLTMKHVVNPAAELFWKHSGQVVDEEGVKDRAPGADDAMWTDMLNSAAILEESGNLLMMEGRARDERWMRYSQNLADAGAQAMAAAQARNAEKAFEAGSALYDTCFNCHGRYIPRPANSLYKAPLPGDEPAPAPK